MRLSRRAILNAAVVAAPLAVGIPMGPVEHVWLTLLWDGQDITERFPATFRWDALMKVTIQDADLKANGSAIYLGEHDEMPFRTQPFKFPIRVRPDDRVHLSWTIRR